MEFEKVQKGIFDVVSENVKKLAELFPTVVKDGQVDFEALKNELGEFETVNEKLSERYELGWAGKEDSKNVAITDVIGRTLKYIPEDSKNSETTENLYIEGDNLEVLKLLRNNYFNRINLIYIDPPYNTDNDFVYVDSYSKEKKESDIEEGELDELGNRLIVNQKSSGRFHANWLNMMYPRLGVARDLLSEDGAILIHIDEHEISNLQKLMDVVFGEENNLGFIIWDKANPKGDAIGVAYQHEALLAYCKNKTSFSDKNSLMRPKKNAEKMINKAKELFKRIGKSELPDDITDIIKKYSLSPRLFDSYRHTVSLEDINEEFSKWIKTQDFSGGEAAYSKIDENGDVYRLVSMAWPNKKKAPDEYFIPLIHPVTGKPCPIPARGWRNPVKTMNDLMNKGLIIFGKDESVQPQRKYLLKENMFENLPSILYYAGSDDKLFNELGLVFDNPKPYLFSKQLIQVFAPGKGDIVIDFFSGSATTAHAVMQLNAEDGGTRKFILVQLPEECDPKGEAYRAGFKNICEIGKSRIVSAGEKIKEENKGKEGIENLDVGFRVFRTADTNIRWFSEAIKSDKISLEEGIMSNKDRLDFNPGYTDIDIVYEILLRHRDIPLSTNVEKLNIVGERTYIFADTVVVCLEENITEVIIDKIAAVEPMPTKVIFRDSAFGDNITLKTNSMLRLEAQMKKNSGIEKKTYRVEFI